MYQKHGYDGLLIVIEGTDGAGKSTQVNLLKKYIENLSRKQALKEKKAKDVFYQNKSFKNKHRSFWKTYTGGWIDA